MNNNNSQCGSHFCRVWENLNVSNLTSTDNLICEEADSKRKDLYIGWVNTSFYLQPEKIQETKPTCNDLFVVIGKAGNTLGSL